MSRRKIYLDGISAHGNAIARIEWVCGADELRHCGVSIGALDEPVNGPRPELFLSPDADGESNVPGWPDDLFLVSGTDQVVERLALGARNEVVVAGHQIEQRAGYLAQINTLPTCRATLRRGRPTLRRIAPRGSAELHCREIGKTAARSPREWISLSIALSPKALFLAQDNYFAAGPKR